MKAIIIALALTLFVQASIGEGIPQPDNGQSTSSTRSGTIATGTNWETDFFIVDSGVSGATVLIVGGMHGNEPAGSRAAAQIRHWPISSGKLVVVPRANVLALKANSRLTPNRPEGEGNLNRNFPQVSEGDESKVTPRGELAAALWKLALETQPDWVIDLHEGFEFRRSHQPPKGKKKSVGSSMVYRSSEKMDALAKQIVAAADATVTDPSKRFSLIRGGPVSSGVANACNSAMGGEGMILETTYRGQPMSLRTRQHRAMVNVLLNHIGLIDQDCRNQLAAPKATDKLQVGVFDGEGTGPSSIKLCGVIDAASDLALYHIGADEMQPDVLKQFDAIVFPGGSGSKQASTIGKSGRDAVRDYVSNGGGVVGVCAGAYLCSAHYDWSLGLLNTKTLTGSVEIPGKGKKKLWYRGRETGIDIELSPQGLEMFSDYGIPRNFVVRYANGPIILPKELDSLDDYEVLAWFRSENHLWKQQEGTMINTPAIVSGSFGKGRVISVSPHPELTPSLHPITTQTIRWTAAASE